MTGRSSRVTRAEVADAAGTSVAVVSYVINGGPRPVATATRERVLAVIARLGYQPNAAARALALGRTGVYGLILPDIANPFFSALAHALEDAVSARGAALLLGDSAEDTTREREVIHAFVGRQVDGIFIVSVDEAPDYSSGTGAGVPILVLDRVNAAIGTEVSSVAIDNRAAAYAATRHLIEHGYTRIGMIAGPAGISVARDRGSGWAEALRDHGLEVNPDWIVRSTFSRRSALEAVVPLLDRDDRPEAVFASSEPQSIGLIRAAAQRNIRIPEEIALISFDGTDDAEFTVPQLSTVVQPFELIARTAAEILMSAGQETTVHQVCPFSIRLRPSCGSHATLPDSQPSTTVPLDRTAAA